MSTTAVWTEAALAVVRGSALPGARTVTRMAAVLERVLEESTDRFEDAVCTGRAIESLAAWAFIVGKNAALRFGRQLARSPAAIQEWDQGELPQRARAAARLLEALPRKATRLGSGQSAILREVYVNVSLHQASRRLGKDRGRTARTSVERCDARCAGWLLPSVNPVNPPPCSSRSVTSSTQASHDRYWPQGVESL
jgi:hypothetical protein